MERQFCINWSATVEEAKQRRKAQRLTQARLAKMAGISTPTISRFEKGEKDIQLSTVMSILTVLGMNDNRNITFPEPNEYYNSSQMAVEFTGRDGDKLIKFAISIEALEDHFNSNGKDHLKTFKANRDRIEHEARRKYLAENFYSGSSILLKTNDIG